MFNLFSNETFTHPHRNRLASRSASKIAVLFAIGAMFAVGCSSKSTTNKDTATDDNSAEPAMPLAENVPGDGTVIGKVTIIGAPAPKPVTTMPGMPSVADESVVVGPNDALQNVIVSVDGAPMSDGKNQKPAVLDQVHSQYVPHVVALQIRQPLTVSSHDPFPHDVHMLSAANPPKNMPFPGPGDQTATFGSPEFFKVQCDIHPSMSAWIGVLPNAYFAVTGKDGSFVIHHVPAGAYTLSAWQERLGTIHQQLFMKAGETVHLDFAYKPQDQK